MCRVTCGLSVRCGGMQANEVLGGTLVSLHNIYFMNRLMAAVRHGIQHGTLDQEERKWVADPQ